MMSAKKSLLTTLLTIALIMGCSVFGVNADQQQRVLILPFYNTSKDILAKDLRGEYSSPFGGFLFPIGPVHPC